MRRDLESQREENLLKSYKGLRKVICQTQQEYEAKMGLQKDEFLKIQDGTFLCDKYGRFYYNPKEGHVELKVNAKFELIKNKVLKVRQMHLLQAKNEFLTEIMDQDCKRDEEEAKKQSLKNRFLLGL